jgi:hypothetical protein
MSPLSKPLAALAALSLSLSFACNRPAPRVVEGSDHAQTRASSAATKAAPEMASAARERGSESEQAKTGSAERSAAAKARKPLVQGEEDVDGKPGLEQLVLYSDGTLLAGKAMGTAALTEAGEFWINERASLRVIALARGVRAVLLALPARDEEDPASRFQLFRLVADKLERILDISPGFASPHRLRFLGDGTARFVEAPEQACSERGAGARAIPLYEVVYELAEVTMTERPRKDVVRRTSCAEPRLADGSDDSL